MKIINASYEILTPSTGNELKAIELAGRTCYKSEDKITDTSAKKFVKTLIKNGHEAMLEHAFVTVKFICDRGISHELVRHRLASFAQESTRFCNYSGDKFGNELTFIKPCFWDEGSDMLYMWKIAMQNAEDMYVHMIKSGAAPQEARSVLPNSIKTEVVVTANFREWRTIFKQRAVGTTGKPHPQMEELMVPLLRECVNLYPDLYDDIYMMWLEKQSDAAPDGTKENGYGGLLPAT